MGQTVTWLEGVRVRGRGAGVVNRLDFIVMNVPKMMLACPSLECFKSAIYKCEGLFSWTVGIISMDGLYYVIGKTSHNL